ncbi:metal ABC transporter ATP-binding protein [Sporolactobacillus terrae]|uniref:metal ABC transporter ATP-binding protein n=1 Tax=Sporolactobacillus terrae TaxID=269673 RepID=UPI00111997D6|nr:ABC transporter ATP-binding protein [Sporolactobacillus terrae]
MLRQLQIHQLQVRFNGEQILNDLSFKVAPGELFAIIGPNGAGKSTLLKSILGLIHPQQGDVSIIGDHRKVIVGYVPQSRVIDDETPISASDFVSLGQISGFLPWLSRKEKKALNEIMQFTDTKRLANKPIGTLSGGERQRVFLAQALVRKPDLLLLDESTANLDPEAQIQMMELVKNAAKEWGVTALFICHDLQMVGTYADHVLLLSRQGYKTGHPADILNNRELMTTVFHGSISENGTIHHVPTESELPLAGSPQ